MKRKKSFPVMLLLLALTLSWPVHAASPADSLWNAGVAAYAEGHWDVALDAWRAIEASGMESARLYCNIGDACFKQGDYARAILYYERALKCDPSDSDARYNLAFAQSFVQDKIDTVPEFFLKSWVRRLSRSVSSDTWATLFLVLLALALTGLLLFLLSASTGLRKTGFYLSILLALLSAACLGFSARQRADYKKTDAAIIIRPVAPVRSSPGSEGAKDLFILHEGTKVRILDQVGDWQKVELPDGRQGWISASDGDLI